MNRGLTHEGCVLSTRPYRPSRNRPEPHQISQPTWIDTNAIMLDDTLLLTVYDLVFVIMTSCAHCHTIIHIQPYRYKHTQQSYTYKQTHTIMQWCCTRVYETFLWKAVPIPGLCACIGAVKRIDCRIPGLCACHPCSLRDRLSKLLFLRLPPCSWPGWFWKWWCLRLQPVEFKGLIVRSLGSMSATCAVYQTDG